MLLKVASKYMKQRWTEQGGEIKKSQMIDRDINDILSETDRTDRKKIRQKFRKGMEQHYPSTC